MKIALFTDGIHPYVIGGMQKHSFYLVKYLAKNGIYIDLYHTNNSRYDIGKLEFFTEDEKKYIRSFVIDFPKKKGVFPGHYIRSSHHYSEGIFNILKKNDQRVDFIYAKGFTAWKLLEEKQKGFKCPPIGINFHGYEMFQQAPDFKSWLQQLFILRKPVLYNIKHADYLFSYGGKISTLIQQLVDDFNKIIEIPTGIEEGWVIPTVNPVNTPLKFIFIGRYERRKGIQELHRVIKKLLKDYSFEFDFIGPIPENKQLKHNNIHYHGSISDVNKIKHILTQSDILVCPSHSEGMPNVITEAMAYGLGIIASDVGAIEKLVSPENGVLIQPGRESELATAMINILKMDKMNVSRLKQNSIEKITKHFLWDTIIVQLIQKIRSLS